MTIYLYTTSSDNRLVTKVLNMVTSLPCTAKGDINISNPVIIIDNLGDAIISKVNYAYIPSWRRYYYITSVTVLTGGRIELTLRCDVLMSFKDSIKNATAFVTRNEREYDRLIPDDRICLEKGILTDSKEVGKVELAQSGWQYYVTTMGASPSEV